MLQLIEVLRVRVRRRRQVAVCLPTLPVANVELDVYSIHGRRVCRLLQGERSTGTHRVNWDGTDRRGQPVPSGVYFARLTTPSGSVVQKVVVAK